MKTFLMPVPGHPEASLEGYLLDCEITLGLEKDRPAVLVCPGGGYVYCSPREGEPVALSYAARGFHAFVLRYSTAKDAAGFTPLEEVSWAIGYIRENAGQWHIAPDKIAVCGFSAGGHLALASGVLAKNRPNAMILGYPAASAPNIPGADFLLKVLEGRNDVTDADAEKYDLISKITKQSPPVFLAATAEDMLTAYGALPVAKAYSDLGMPYELHVFQYGPHGYSLANEVSADGSEKNLDPAFAQWLELSVQWLHKTFGKLTFGDKSTHRMVQILKEMGYIK
ncbi:alpha/beta hydrolase [bacterium]|nr:alpha/beta hydrolase [bacterium]MDY4582259.1 alpha/beta hydrolase [Candidatus Faecousia sp.]